MQKLARDWFGLPQAAQTIAVGDRLTRAIEIQVAG
jgi:hypothetical protein